MLEKEIEIVTKEASKISLYLEHRLYEFNVKSTGISDGEQFAGIIKSDDGQIIAGVSGHTWGGHCEIKQLWVSAPNRGRGLGMKLMFAAEKEAVRRGCHQIVVATHTFQAPRFYEKLGFTRIAEIPDYPMGHQYVCYRKLLTNERQSRESQRSLG